MPPVPSELHSEQAICLPSGATARCQSAAWAAASAGSGSVKSGLRSLTSHSCTARSCRETTISSRPSAEKARGPTSRPSPDRNACSLPVCGSQSSTPPHEPIASRFPTGENCSAPVPPRSPSRLGSKLPAEIWHSAVSCEPRAATADRFPSAETENPDSCTPLAAKYGSVIERSLVPVSGSKTSIAEFLAPFSKTTSEPWASNVTNEATVSPASGIFNRLSPVCGSKTSTLPGMPTTSCFPLREKQAACPVTPGKSRTSLDCASETSQICKRSSTCFVQRRATASCLPSGEKASGMADCADSQRVTVVHCGVFDASQTSTTPSRADVTSCVPSGE